MLEARDRVGGRVHTVAAPFKDGLHAEGGGESIDDNHDAIQGLLARYGLATERRLADRDATATVFAGAGALTAAAFAARRSGRVLADYDRFYDETAALGVGIDPEHPDDAPRAEELDRASLADFLDDLHLVPEARFLVEAAETGEYAADPRDVSLLFHAQQAAAVAGVPDSAVETMRISGGNSRLPEAMAAALGDALVTGRPRPDRRPRPTTSSRCRPVAHAHRRAARPRPPAGAAPPHPVPSRTPTRCRRRGRGPRPRSGDEGDDAVPGPLLAGRWRLGTPRDRPALPTRLGRHRLRRHDRRDPHDLHHRSRRRAACRAVTDADGSPSCTARSHASSPRRGAGTSRTRDRRVAGRAVHPRWVRRVRAGSAHRVLGRAPPARRRPGPLRRRAHGVARGVHGERDPQRPARVAAGIGSPPAA